MYVSGAVSWFDTHYFIQTFEDNFTELSDCMETQKQYDKHVRTNWLFYKH